MATTTLSRSAKWSWYIDNTYHRHRWGDEANVSWFNGDGSGWSKRLSKVWRASSFSSTRFLDFNVLSGLLISLLRENTNATHLATTLGVHTQGNRSATNISWPISRYALMHSSIPIRSRPSIMAISLWIIQLETRTRRVLVIPARASSSNHVEVPTWLGIRVIFILYHFHQLFNYQERGQSTNSTAI